MEGQLVIHSHTGYSLKADIWSFGITALELAYGCPPLSHLSPSKSLLMKITNRFRFSDYENNSNNNNKEGSGSSNCKKQLSKSFKEMVAACLNQDPAKRPSADKLLRHCSFFKNCKGPDFLVKNILTGLPTVEDRYKAANKTTSHDEECDDHHNDVVHKVRRISGWNFNLDEMKLDSVFPTENLINFESGTNTSTTTEDLSGGSGSSGESSMMSSPRPVVDKGAMVGSLVVLRKSLDEQREKVVRLIGLLGGGDDDDDDDDDDEQGEEGKEEMNEKLRVELEIEKAKSFELEMELGFLKLLLVSAEPSYDDE